MLRRLFKLSRVTLKNLVPNVVTLRDATSGYRWFAQKITSLGITFAIFLASVVYATSSVFAQTGLVAIVNKEVIGQKDLEDFINFMRMQMSTQYSEQEVEQRINQMRPDLINRLIEDRLILQAAYKENIIIDQSQIKARVEQIKRSYSTETDFHNALVSQGLSLADVELKIKEQLLMTEIIDKKVRSKIVVKPQEVTNYYYAHSEDFHSPEQRLLRFLIINDSKLVEHIQKRITEYKDLDAIAKSHSLKITDLDWVTVEQLKSEIADVVFNLEVGKVSPFLDSNGNFYIFEVKAIKPPDTRALFDVQEAINRFLFERKMQEVLVEWLEKLKSEAYIEIKDEYRSS